MKKLDAYFQIAEERKASDVHLIAGQQPQIRVGGELETLDDEVLDPKELEAALFGILDPEQKKRYEEALELDVSYSLGETRFRVNIHQQEGMIGMAARRIPMAIPSNDDLRFEPALREAEELLDGLVLVVGPTGHGKSTTLASMIESINLSRKAHIVTVEDPVEFLFQEKKALIEQREIGTDTRSFAEALKHVLRQDPDVILVGEMRDPETIATVLTAAETGHLVFSTLHTSSAAEAIERIVDVFEGSKQKQVLIQLSSVLRVVVAQQLIPGKNGGRVAAREVLINTPAVANLIRENNIAQIKSAIQTGAKDGMISMENAVKELLEGGLIDEHTAERRVGAHRKV